jgi:putative DNA primase/helicase
VRANAYATAKRLPIDFLTKLGIREMSYEGGRALRISHLHEAGEEASIRFRLRVEKLEGGDDRFKWRGGSKAIPYGLWRVNLTQATGAIVLVEGESDAQTLWFHGIPAPRPGTSARAAASRDPRDRRE